MQDKTPPASTPAETGTVKARYASTEEFASEFGDYRVRKGSATLEDTTKPIDSSDQNTAQGLMGPVGGFNVDPTII